jgi:hypothetical protein
VWWKGKEFLLALRLFSTISVCWDPKIPQDLQGTDKEVERGEKVGGGQWGHCKLVVAKGFEDEWDGEYGETWG